VNLKPPFSFNAALWNALFEAATLSAAAPAATSRAAASGRTAPLPLLVSFYEEANNEGLTGHQLPSTSTRSDLESLSP